MTSFAEHPHRAVTSLAMPPQCPLTTSSSGTPVRRRIDAARRLFVFLDESVICHGEHDETLIDPLLSARVTVVLAEPV